MQQSVVQKLALFVLISKFVKAHDVEVMTSKGPVLGAHKETTDPRFNDAPIAYNQFINIPFAKPPVGDLRFRPPQPVEPWDYLLNATKTDFNICYQTAGIGLGKETEDCLYLDVYVPRNNYTESGPLPVIVWLSGGAFIAGGKHYYGPDFFITHNVLVVIINYRVGPLGFFTLGTEEAPGNVGLLDQIAALEWVQQDIAAFGGDPSSVTLAGQSAGSYSAFYLLASPKSRGLFKGIIGQSGVGGLAPAFHQYSPQQAIRYGHEAAIELGCLQTTPPEILACLKNESNFWLSLVDYSIGVMSQPVVDGTFTDDPLLPDYPSNIFESGDYDTSVDILLGANYNEGLLFTQLFYSLPSLFPAVIQEFDYVGPTFLFMKKLLEITEKDKQLAKEVLLHYTGTESVANVTIDDIERVTAMLTDAFFWYGVHRFVEIHREHSEGKIYQYINKHVNTYNQFVWSVAGHLNGTIHADDLFLEFFPFFTLSESDAEASRFLTSTWSNFIKTGDPGMGWDPITRSDWKYMSISDVPTMEMEDDYLERMDFWSYVVSQLD